MKASDTEQTQTRRDFLKVGGAAITTGALLRHGVSLADATRNTHELVINAPPRGSGAHPYAFSVGGTVEKIDTPTMAPISPTYVTIDPEDDVDDGCAVHGWTAGGYDAYHFTGDLVVFHVPEQWAHNYNVWFDGTKVNALELQTDDPDIMECGTPETTTEQAAMGEGSESSEFPSGIHIVVPDGSSATFSLGVTGLMQLPDGSEVGDVSANMGGLGASGNAARIPFSGVVSHMYLSDYDMEIRIVQDGSYSK